MPHDLAAHPAASTPPRWWTAPLIVTTAACVLGIAVLQPWAGSGPQPAARATWIALHQVALAALAVMAWHAPRLTGLRHTMTARATAAAVAIQLALSVWNNQLGGADQYFGTPRDTMVRSVLTVLGGVATVTVFASLTRRRARSGQRDLAAIVDATVVSSALGLLTWETLTSTLGLTPATVNAISLATAIIVASTAVFVRLLLSAGRRCGAIRLLSVGIVLGGIALFVFTLDAAGGARPRSHWWELPLLLAFAALVAAVMHPSLRDLLEGGGAAGQASESTARALVLCAAVVMPAAVTLLRTVTEVSNASAGRWSVALSLPSAVAGVVITAGVAWRLARLVRDRERAHRMLEHRSRHDDLTGLPNRAHLLQRLRDEIARVRASSETDDRFGLMFLDLDDFKSINDTYGHHAGDVVLIEVARRLADAVRTDDLVGRMAGDEFVLLCGGPSDEASLARLTERVRTRVEAPMPVDFGVVTPGVSIGVVIVGHALASPDDAVSAILRTVDARMYDSKRAARAAAPGTDDGTDPAHARTEGASTARAHGGAS